MNVKFHKIFAILLTSILLFGLVTVANADDPPPGQGNFDPLPIQPGKLVVDPATGAVLQAELAGAEATTPTAAPTAATAPLINKPDHPPSTSLQPTELNRANLTTTSAQGITPETLLLNDLGQSSLTGQEIGPTASTSIVFETFEGVFPTGSWSNSGTPQWDDVNCFPVDANLGGSWSAWPAANVANPCPPTLANYPDNANSVLKYGPFSLADAQTASLDFSFRTVSQSCTPVTNCDYLFWGASTNNVNFSGEFAAGTHTSGPFPNGYNFASLDLTFVAGQPQVWIAFIFASNNDGITAQGPFIDLVSLRKNSDTRVYLTNENFEVLEFPNAFWESFDLDSSTNGELYWDDVQLGQGGFSCLPRSGEWSIWPADEGANALNSCAGDNYANNMRSWMIHGPFSLVGASEAWVDFYFRNQSQPGDTLFWGASTNGINFFGPVNLSGTQTGGPYGNGYNLMRFSLNNVFTLGDLRGQPQVWLAFFFQSDNADTDEGPFIDDVSVVVERSVTAQLFLPVIIKNPAPIIPKANLFINNQTGGLITSYRVFSPKLNGVVIPNIICANIPAGATNFNCNATFDVGTYQVSSTNTCNPPTTSGQVAFAPGNNVRLVRCVN